MPSPRDYPPLPREAFDPEAFAEALGSGNPIAVFKAALKHARDYFDQQFQAGAFVRPLIFHRAQLVDAVLRAAWQRFNLDSAPIALVAVGGYGRGELHPHSDIDLLILLRQEQDLEPYRDNIESFLTFLWDINLQIGQSVRTLQECAEEAVKDITVITTLIESRTLTGPATMRSEMMELVGTAHMWPIQEFFHGKLDEQRERHDKYNNTEYNLEPNIKGSPGGLRDVQTIAWIAKRHFGGRFLEDLLDRGFLNEDEFKILLEGQTFLWQIRYGLHMLANRPEDRLLFDHQRTLAKMFGYEDDEQSLAVEKFMKDYYRCAMALAELNEMLMQHFDEDIIRACEPENILELNARFRIRNGDIEAVNDRVFQRYPWAMMEMFVLLAQNPHIRGVRASTIRLMRQDRHLIDDAFRQDIRNTSLFIELLRSPHRVFTQLKRMKRYGVLGRYLPEFGKVVGQMQHDLFHIYTVDAHTLLVVKNLRRFSQDDASLRFPVAAQVVKRLPKLELLYIAGLYHDIAKGRGGDHSVLGEEDAEEFCRRHRLSKWDTNLVGWLVRHHLMMSSVAQRHDISDPEVIQAFARKVGDRVHLDYLYALTVADIRATNPTLWNAWKDSLLRQLYDETKRVLRRGLENPIDKQDWIDDTQRQALELLQAKGIDEALARAIWGSSGDDYFLRETGQDIAWHTEAISRHPGEDPLVLIKKPSSREFEGATQVFVRTKDRANVFAASATALDSLNLSIHDARIYSSSGGYTIDTFFVLDENGKPIGDDPHLMEHIRQTVLQELSLVERYSEVIRKRTPRQLKHFAMPTRTMLTSDSKSGYTMLEVITPDRPGLLARIGRIFIEFGIQLHNAKIATLGERVEDVFFITDQQGQPLSDPELCERFQSAIREQLDAQVANTQKTL